MSPSSDPIDPSDLDARIALLEEQVYMLGDAVRTLVALLGMVNARALGEAPVSAEERHDQFRENDTILGTLERQLETAFKRE